MIKWLKSVRGLPEHLYPLVERDVYRHYILRLFSKKDENI